MFSTGHDESVSLLFGGLRKQIAHLEYLARIAEFVNLRNSYGSMLPRNRELTFNEGIVCRVFPFQTAVLVGP